MTRRLSALGLMLLMVVTMMPAHAQTMYIDDMMLAPLRSGQGLEYRIVHKGLKSGTKVTVIRHDPESSYTLVRTEGGTEGWLPTRFLSAQPIAAERIVAVQEELDKAQTTLTESRARLDSLQREYGQLKDERDQLKNQLAAVGAELERIKSVSTNALSLDARNQELQEANQQLQNDVELLNADNQRLKDRKDSDFMLLSAGLILLGVILALVIPLLKPARRNDTWA